MSTHRISVLVRNQPGVLSQLSELFSHRGYNIETIKAGKYKKTSLTKIELTATLTEDGLETLTGQIGGLSHVVAVDVAVQRRFSFWLVAVCLGITLLGNNLPAPLYSLYRTEWQLSPSIVTLMYALYALVVVPTLLIVSSLAARYGLKQVIRAGIVFSIFGSLGLMLADGVAGLLTARVFQGLSVGMLNGIAVAAMTELHIGRDRVKSAFIAAIAGTLGNAVAPLISGGLGQYAPYPLHLSYGVHILLALLCLLGLHYMVGQRREALLVPSVRLPRIARADRAPLAMAASTSFLSWGIMSLMLSILPTYLNLFVENPSLVLSGAVVALALGVSTAHQIKLKNQPVIRSILIGYACLVAGLAGMVLTLMTNSLWLLMLTTVLIGLGNGPSYAGALAYLNQSAADESRTGMTSYFFIVTYLGMSVPILTLGLVGEWIGLEAAVIGYTFVMVTGLCISAWQWLREWKSD